MKQTVNIIKYKWDYGVYSLADMMKKVKKGQITEEDFFNITRYHIDGIKKLKNLKKYSII